MKTTLSGGCRLRSDAALTISALALLVGTAPAKAAPIPMDQIGAVACKQYQGDGLSMTATAKGARLRCVFQKLEGEATPQGLWLTSTTDPTNGQRFRVVAMAAGRQEGEPASLGGRASPRALTSSGNVRESGLAGTLALPGLGKVEVAGQVARFIRPGLTEEYSVSMDGIRQDFLIERPPLNPRLLAAAEQSADGSTLNQLRVELEVTGARVEPLANGARLVLAGSGRKIAYSRLRATDARGKELPARLVVEGDVAAARQSAAVLEPEDGGALPSRRYARLTVLVDDAGAEYPVRIDPTFSDDNWISLNPSTSGPRAVVYAAAVDGTGNLYMGGDFRSVGNVFATNIAKWNGTSWSPLGSGMGGATYPYVWALTVSGSDLYAGGGFRTAGGSAAYYVAKWNGSGWSALGSGMDNEVRALAVSGTNLYVGGYFATAGGREARSIAKWNGSSWSAVGSGTYGQVDALAVSGSDLYAGGSFTTVGGSPANYIAKWDGNSWSPLGSGMGFPFARVYALAVSGGMLYAGGYFTTAGGNPANNIAKWNGTSWSALGSGMSGGPYSTHVSALAVLGGDLYAGGSFTNAGGSPANYIAKWDGSSWSALGSGMNGLVYALAVSGSALYAGGGFTTAGGKVSACVAEAILAGGQFTGLGYSPAIGFGFTFSDGVVGQYYFIQTSPSLAEGSWIDWLGFTYTGPITLTDPSARAVPRKFYRAVWAP
jgi:hypothetical protein